MSAMQAALPLVDSDRPIVHWLAPSMCMACGAEWATWSTNCERVTCDACKEAAA